MYSWGTDLVATGKAEIGSSIPEDTTPEKGTYYRYQRGDRVLLYRRISPPLNIIQAKEKDYCERVVAEVKNKGHTPYYCHVQATDLQTKQYKDYEECYATMMITVDYRAEHNPAFIAYICLMVLGFLIVAWLTSPYWGPVLYTLVGIDPNNPPPAPSVPGLNQITQIAFLVGSIVILVTVVPIVADALKSWTKKKKRR